MPETSGSDAQQRVFDLTAALIREASVTPEDGACQDILRARLEPLGFETQQIDAGGVRNLWAIRPGTGPHLCFAGHTDVVPPGPLSEWDSDPFIPSERDGYLFGRGAADMKSSLAAMIVAIEDALTGNDVRMTLSLLITSDEEGDAVHGTRHVIDVLRESDVTPDFCVVGEPSSSLTLGDTVRCGRRGSLNAELKVKGIQGHVAYPDDADNPIHGALTALDELARYVWDEGDDYYPPTSLQISNIAAGTGASNVIPGEMNVRFNLRFNTAQTSEGIQARVHEIFAAHEFDYELRWQLSGLPFLTESGALTDAVSNAIASTNGAQTELSTSGGTSDGRFISPWGVPGSATVQVVELGPINETIHKINECVRIADLGPLAEMYLTGDRRTGPRSIGVKKYIIVGLLVFVIAAIAFAPARLITGALGEAEGLELIQTRGTLWNGTSRLLVQGHDLGPLQWRFDPSTLLDLAPGHQWTLAHPEGTLEGTASVDTDSAHITVNGSLGPDAVNPWLRLYDISLSGDFDLSDVAVEIDQSSGQVTDIQGTIGWQGGNVGYTLGGLLKSTNLPPLQALLDTPIGKPTAVVRQLDHPTPLLVAELGDSGFVKVGITKLLTSMLGNPWAGEAADDAVVLVVEEQFF